MSRKVERVIILLLLALFVVALLSLLATIMQSRLRTNRSSPSEGYVGSATCIECHEDFYELWATSHHGLAMQPYTDDFAAENLGNQIEAVKIDTYNYTAGIGEAEGWVQETGDGVDKKYPIVHVMGGKNVYYFLTPMERGKLQVLPVAYDVLRKEWFDTAESGMRHFPDSTDAPLHWTDSFYTFNTSCHGCHISQLSTNYDSGSDSYRTTWAEPGINCETCHGPCQEHVEVCLAAGDGKAPDDLKIISNKAFSPEQTNSMCASCHSKLTGVSTSFIPGEDYFDHFDLTTLENPDYYPDGRDLGENYTFTSWRMSACAKSGKLDCVDCHTSSGRYRFDSAETANNACLPCHNELVESPALHTHHAADSDGNKCVSCHMPMTKFARMTRSDHSMRPPAPAATIAFKSPNACNICHSDKDAVWADKFVRQWYKDDYQKSIIYQGRLVDAARKQDWKQLDKILEYIISTDSDEVVTASLIRILGSNDSQKKWSVVIAALKSDPSPLVRAAAAAVLGGNLTEESLPVLLAATGDKYRLVRVRAAASLAAIPVEMVAPDYRADLKNATEEYITALNARPDNYSSQYNLGNFQMARRQYENAVSSFEKAAKLRPDFLPPYVNIAFAYSAIGDNDKAEASLHKALHLDPNNLPVHVNLGMLLGELGRMGDAEDSFRAALKIDPDSAVATYNLGVIVADKEIDEALKLCKKAYEIQPQEPKYGYTYAFYLMRSGLVNQAVEVLKTITDNSIPYADAYFLLGHIYETHGQSIKAKEVYATALKNPGLSQQQRQEFSIRIQKLGLTH